MFEQKCPLPLAGGFLVEEDIPPECRECLDITLDSDRGAEHSSHIIGVPFKEDYSQKILNESCEHDTYYWITSLRRGEAAKRIIEIAAECDVCQNFSSSVYTAVCKTEN